ncbi:MAG: glycosyl hydrolase family 18 protein [Pseudomonadota bacterium]
MKKIFSILALLACGSVYASQSSYTNMFIAYYTPSDVAAMADYAMANKLGGYIMWEAKGDTPYDSATPSLLKTLSNKYQNKTAPLVMGYWSDWSPYSNSDGPHGKAIPDAVPYPIPGATNVQNSNNPDLTKKLEGLNVITYAFLEGEPTTGSHPGTLYFFDPWSDLYAQGRNSDQDAFCAAHQDICWYVPISRNTPIEQAGQMGNFNAFLNLKHQKTSNPLGSLKKVISIGGYGHDATFEVTFNNQTYSDNFVNSIVALMTKFKNGKQHLDGVCLDYENPNMTYRQSISFAALVKQLSTAVGKDNITVTILASPAYIMGTKNNYTLGFSPGTLTDISKAVKHIDLMTYDFHGAFDYAPDGSGLTGFLTNLYLPGANDGVQNGYDPQFSVETSVEALMHALGAEYDSSQIVIGIPAYGRSLQGISSQNGGLFQPVTKTLIPQGNLDSAACHQDITADLSDNGCSGAFEYRYIVNNMLGKKGFTESTRSHIDDNNNVVTSANGTTAFASKWTPWAAGADHY